MRRAASHSPARPRSRRKAAASTPAAAAEAVVSAPEGRNVGSIEALLSLTVGVLMIVAGLVPRSFKQVFLLALGGGLLHRGLKGECGFYRTLGVSTADKPAVPAKD